MAGKRQAKVEPWTEAEVLRLLDLVEMFIASKVSLRDCWNCARVFVSDDERIPSWCPSCALAARERDTLIVLGRIEASAGDARSPETYERPGVYDWMAMIPGKPDRGGRDE